MDGAKIYGMCLERLRFQINRARARSGESGMVLLESYNTGDVEDLIDILELYDIEDRSRQGLTEKLDDLSYTVSVLIRDLLLFDYTLEGHLGLYLSLVPQAQDESSSPLQDTAAFADQEVSGQPLGYAHQT